MIEDKGTNRMIRDMKVKCKYEPDGCKWTGDISNLEVSLIVVYTYIIGPSQRLSPI